MEVGEAVNNSSCKVKFLRKLRYGAKKSNKTS